jgi:hypothetical protein
VKWRNSHLSVRQPYKWKLLARGSEYS